MINWHLPSKTYENPLNFVNIGTLEIEVPFQVTKSGQNDIENLDWKNITDKLSNAASGVLITLLDPKIDPCDP